MPEINETKYAQVVNAALMVFDQLFKKRSDEPLTQTEAAKIKGAQSLLASYPRHRQALTSTTEVALAIFKGAAENEEQYRQFIREHVPQSGLVKYLPAALLRSDRSAQELGDKNRNLTETLVAERKQWQDEKAELLFKIQNMEKKEVTSQ